MVRTITLTALAAAALLLAGCASHGNGHDHASAGGGTTGGGTTGGAMMGGGMMGGGMMGGGMGGGMTRGRMAVASLSPTQDSAVRGLVMFHERGGQLVVHARITGLKPNAEHGFHVHETGSCASTDGSSAGGHFNPDGKPHGPQNAPHHAGDLPALKADASGAANQHFTLTGPTVTAGAASVVGRSVIVHALPDDYTTQPTGNSGGRIACGVIAAH